MNDLDFFGEEENNVVDDSSFFAEDKKVYGAEEAISKATDIVALTNPPDIGATHDDIVRGLVSEGTHPLVDEVEARFRAYNRAKLYDDIKARLIDPTVPIEEKQNLVGLHNELDEISGAMRINTDREYFRGQAIANAFREDLDEEGRKLAEQAALEIDTKYDRVASITSVFEALQERIHKPSVFAQTVTKTLGLDEDSRAEIYTTATLQAATEATQVVFDPFETSSMFTEIHNKFFDGISKETITGYVLPGVFLRKFKEYFDKLPDDKAVEEAQRLASIIENSTTYFGDNSLTKDNIISFLNDAITMGAGESNTVWERVSDVFNILQMWPAFRALKSGINTFRSGGVASKFGLTAAANTDSATKLAVEAIKNPKVATGVGITTSVAATAALLPKEIEAVKPALSRTDDIISKLAAGTPERLAALKGHSEDIAYLIVSEEAKKGITNKVIAQLEEAKGVHLYNNQTAVTPTHGGLDIKAVYGKEKSGFMSIDELKQMAEETFKDTKYNVLLKQDGILVPVDDLAKAAKEPGEYFIEVTGRYEWDEFSEALQLGRVNSLGGKLSPFQFDYNSAFYSKEIRSAIGRSKQVSDKIYSIMHDNAAGLFKLSQKELRFLYGDLTEASVAKGRHLTREELLKLGADDKIIDVYHSYAANADVLWLHKAEKLAKNLDKRGYVNSIINEEQKFHRIGKVLQEGPVDIDTAFDIATNKAVKLSKADIEKLYAEGGTLVKFESPIISRVDTPTGKAIRSTTYGIVPKGSATKIAPRTSNIMGYVPLYYPKSVTAPFIILQRTADALIDGKKAFALGKPGFVRAIGTADTSTQAKRVMEKLNKTAEPGTTFEFRHSRELTAKESDFVERSFLETRSPSTLSRGEGLSSADSLLRNERIPDHLADTRNPVTSYDKAIRAMSQEMGVGRVVDDMKVAWENSFGHLAEGGKFPGTVKDIRKPGMLTDKEVRSAQAAYRHIQNLEGTIKNVIGDAIHLKVTQAADMLSRMGAERAAEFLARHPTIGDMKFIRQLNTFKLITSNVLRQWFVQPMQVAFTAAVVPPKYMAGPIWAESAAVLTELVRRGLPEGVPLKGATSGMVDSLTKLTKYSKEDLAKLVDAVQESGVTIVDSHDMLKQISFRTFNELQGDIGKIERGAEVVTNVMRKFNSAFANVGFKPAEQANQVIHWLAAKERILEKFPDLKIGTPEFRAKVAAEQAALSLDMKNGFAYRADSLLSTATQFLTFQHKALLAATFNKSFTKVERAKLGALTALMFGVEGLGFKKAFEWGLAKAGVDVSALGDMWQEAVEAASNGMFSWSFNKMMVAAGYDQIKLDFSGFAPLNAQETNIVKLIDSAIETRTFPFDLVVGPTKNTYDAFSSSAKMVGTLFSNSELFDNKTFYKMLAKEVGGSIIPLISKYGQYQVAKNTGLYPNNVGTFFNEMSAEEAFITAAFGIKPAKLIEEQEVSKIMSNKKAANAAAKSDARVIYEQISKITINLNPEGLPSDKLALNQEKMERSIRLIGKLTQSFDPAYRQQVQREVYQMLRNDPQVGGPKVLANIAKFYSRVYGNDSDTVDKLLRIKNKGYNLGLTDAELEGIDTIIDMYKRNIETANKEIK